MSSKSLISAIKQRFPRPRVVSFDAFGTLYTPKEAVSTQYYKISRQYIPELREIHESEVIDAIKTARRLYPNYGKTVNMTQEQWWTKVIEQVFQHYEYDKSAMIPQIFNYFVDANAYHVYDDVMPTLEYLQSQGIKMVISSNSDDRLKQVIESLKLDAFFSNVYLSYDLDCSKPDPLFWSKVTSDLGVAKNDQIWHCGDDHAKDFLSSARNGLVGVYIDRSSSSPVSLTADGIILNSLSHLRDLIS